MFYLFFGAILASIFTGSWMPILLMVGIGTVAVWGAVASSGSALDVRLV